MELNLKGKKALVTGSSKGIGFAIAQTLLSEGCDVMFNARQPFDLKSAHRGKAHFVQADVTSSLGIQEILKSVETHFAGQIDILVCNVGSGRSASPGTETSEDWEKSIRLNLFSATNVIGALKKSVKPQGGVILCISSICGMEQFGAPLTYGAAKAALHSYVVGISKVLGKEGIRINAIAPGNILFEGSVWDKKMSEDKAAVQKMLDQDVALRCLGEPQDVANMAAFLVSEKSKFVTGSVTVVDGGQLRSW